jgi:CheY-like chemotaxis protein
LHKQGASHAREIATMMQRVLVVDDEWLILDFTRAILEDMGCEVVIASAATEALQRIRTDDRIDLLITDIQMPGMSGAELIQYDPTQSKGDRDVRSRRSPLWRSHDAQAI